VGRGRRCRGEARRWLLRRLASRQQGPLQLPDAGFRRTPGGSFLLASPLRFPVGEEGSLRSPGRAAAPSAPRARLAAPAPVPRSPPPPPGSTAPSPPAAPGTRLRATESPAAAARGTPPAGRRGSTRSPRARHRPRACAARRCPACSSTSPPARSPAPWARSTAGTNREEGMPAPPPPRTRPALPPPEGYPARSRGSCSCRRRRPPARASRTTTGARRSRTSCSHRGPGSQPWAGRRSRGRGGHRGGGRDGSWSGPPGRGGGVVALGVPFGTVARGRASPQGRMRGRERVRGGGRARSRCTGAVRCGMCGPPFHDGEGVVVGTSPRWTQAFGYRRCSPASRSETQRWPGEDR